MKTTKLIGGRTKREAENRYNRIKDVQVSFALLDRDAQVPNVAITLFARKILAGKRMTLQEALDLLCDAFPGVTFGHTIPCRCNRPGCQESRRGVLAYAETDVDGFDDDTRHEFIRYTI